MYVRGVNVNLTPLTSNRGALATDARGCSLLRYLLERPPRTWESRVRDPLGTRYELGRCGPGKGCYIGAVTRTGVRFRGVNVTDVYARGVNVNLTPLTSNRGALATDARGCSLWRSLLERPPPTPESRVRDPLRRVVAVCGPGALHIYSVNLNLLACHSFCQAAPVSLQNVFLFLEKYEDVGYIQLLVPTYNHNYFVLHCCFGFSASTRNDITARASS